MSAMSENEMRCFKAAMKWQRKELLQDLLCSLIPRLPFINTVRRRNLLTKLLYTLIVLALTPFLSLFWVAYILLQLLIFPYQYWAAYFKPRGLRGPGERNLQGVHNAFAKHIDLSPTHYIGCVNEWIEILYGDGALPEYRMENYLDKEQLRLMTINNSSHRISFQIRSALTIARESLSKKLGCY